MTELVANGSAPAASAGEVVNQVITVGSQKLQQAIDMIKGIGVTLDQKQSQAFVTILDEIKDVDPDQTYFIARVASMQVSFDQLVVEKVNGSAIDSEYQKINAIFADIRAKSKKAIEDANTGSHGLFSKLTNMVHDFTSGTVADQMTEVQDIFERITQGMKKQVDAETVILDAYRLFRGALGQSQVAALNVKKKLDDQLAAAKSEALAAQAAYDAAASETDEAKKVSIGLARDEANDALAKATRRMDTGKDVSDQAISGYAISEVTMAKLSESTALKDRIYHRLVIAYAQNRSALAAMKATYSSTVGLAEGVNAMDAMSDGMNKSLEDLASVTGTVNKRAIETGYGKTVSADSFKAFTDAMIAAAEETEPLIEQSRAESTANALAIQANLDATKKRYSEIVNKIAA